MACVSIRSDSSRRLFSSSSTCAKRRLPRITPETSAVVSQMRKHTTATERNRARDAINQFVKKVKRLTKLKGRSDLPFQLCNVSTLELAATGSGVAGAVVRILSPSRRRMAFNFPPSNSKRQVRYIHVSNTTMDASARYVGL